MVPHERTGVRGFFAFHAKSLVLHVKIVVAFFLALLVVVAVFSIGEILVEIAVDAVFSHVAVGEV